MIKYSLILILFASCSLPCDLKKGQIDDSYVWLHVEGKYILRSPSCSDPNAIWMGCGMARKTAIPRPTPEQAEEFALWCVKNHFNLARLRWNIDTSSADIITHTINPYLQALKKHQIYAVLDCHSDMVDGWDPNNPEGRCKLWFDNWLAIAEYYKNEPWIMGYELNNEPRMNSHLLVRELYKKCLDNIRTVDQKHIIILGSYNWSHARGSFRTWAEGLPADQQFRPDPPYNQVIFNFHEYPQVNNRGGYPVYFENETSNGVVNEIVAGIQEKYNVPFMCTEFGVKANTENPPTIDEARRHEQEIIEMCYGKPGFWKDFTGENKAFPPRGNPAGPGYQSWLAWWDYNKAEDTYNQFVFCEYMDILSYAALRQASQPPSPK